MDMDSRTETSTMHSCAATGFFSTIFYQVFFLVMLSISMLVFTACSDSSSAPDDPNSGTLRVTVETIGGDTSPVGYTFMLQGVGSFETDANEEYTYNNVPEGNYTVELTQKANHCTVITQNPRTVQIIPGTIVDISFQVECKAILRDRIVFLSNHEGAWSVYSNSVDQPEKMRIPQFNVSATWRPSVSPDGTKIAFVSTAQGFPLSQIWVMDADGTNFANITQDAQAHSEFPSWSPDGSQIAYHRYTPNGEGDIYVMNADGTDKRNVTNSSTGDWWPSWHPDGNRLAFHTIESGVPFYISTINVDGSGRQEVLRQPSLFFRNPSWSPDGSRLAFQCNIESNIWEICVANGDGSNPQNITNLGVAGRQHRLVSWSPDGNMLTFDSNRDGQENTFDIFVMNANGSGLSNLTNNMNSSSVMPFWSPVE